MQLPRSSDKTGPGPASPRKESGGGLSRSSGGIAQLLRGSGGARHNKEDVPKKSEEPKKTEDKKADTSPLKSKGKAVLAGLLKSSRFGEKKRSVPAVEERSAELQGGPVNVVKTSQLSGFNIPLSQMQASSHASAAAAVATPGRCEDHVYVAPSQAGRRLRRSDEEGESGQCENCRGEALAWQELCECYLCERLVCQQCSRSNLCNVCAPKNSWSGSAAAFQRALGSAEKSLLTRNLVEAAALCGQAIAINPQDPAPFVVRAECSRLAGELGSALSDLTVAVDLGGSLAALSQRMMLYWNEGETDMAKEDATAILAHHPSARGTLARLQAMLVKEGVETCREGCDLALASAPASERLELLVLRAWCHMRTCHWASAVTDANAVLAECAADNVLLHSRCAAVIGRVLQGTGMYKEALAVLQRAVDLGHTQSLVYVAVVTFLLGRRDECVQTLVRLDRRDVQLALLEWVDALTENAKDLCAAACVKALFLMDATTQKLVPEARMVALQRTLKVQALKNGNLEESPCVHHPAALPIRIRVAHTKESLTVRAPPQATIGAVLELVRMMSPAVGNDVSLHLLDSAQPRWLEMHETARAFEGELHLLSRSDGTRIKPDEVEVLFAPFAEDISMARRFSRSTTVMHVLRIVAEVFGSGPIGYGLWNGRNWLLPSQELEQCVPENVFMVFLRYKATPCASAMLIEGFPVFCALSDCAFEVEGGRLSAWGPGLGKFGYAPSGIPEVLQSFEGERIMAFAAGITHVAGITYELQVVVAGVGVDKVDLPPQLNGNVVGVACGYNFSVALTDDGRVCCWGAESTCGQLGVISKTAAATQVDLPEKMISVGCGYAFGVAVSVTGKLYAWGDKNVVGRARNAHHHVPDVLDSGLADKVVESVSCGIHHALALTTEGELWGWGVNNASQIHPTKSGIVSSAKASDKGTFFAPVLVRSGIPRGSHVLCGEFHSLLVVSQAQTGSINGCSAIIEHERRVTEIAIWGDNRTGVFGTSADDASPQAVHTRFGGTVDKVTCGQAYVQLKLLQPREIMAWGKAPHKLVECTVRPISVYKYWLSDALENAANAVARIEAARRYDARYDLTTFCGKLNLKGAGIMWIPEDVKRLRGVTEIDLSDNGFICPPGSLRECFPNLQKVRLRGNPGCEESADGAIPADLAEGCSLVALQAHMRKLERSRSVWPTLKVTFTGTPEAHVLKLVKKLSGGLAFENVTSDDYSELVLVDDWQAIDCNILGFVHPGGAGDVAGAAAREEFFSHRSVHVVVLSALAPSVQDGFVLELVSRLELLGCSKYPPMPLIVVLNHCLDGEAGVALQQALEKSKLAVDVVCVNSSIGLGIPELEQRIVAAGRLARLVAAPTPRPLCLLQRAVQLWFETHYPVLSHDQFASLCVACLVPNVTEARQLLQERGAAVSLAKSGIFCPRWLGLELCNMAVLGAPSPTVEAPMHDVLRKVVAERSLCIVKSRDVPLLPFGRVAPECPADAAQLIAETIPQQRTLFRVPKAVAGGLQCRVMCKVSQINGSAEECGKVAKPMQIKHIWQGGAIVQSQSEVGWIRQMNGGETWEIGTSAVQFGAPPIMCAALVVMVEQAVEAYLGQSNAVSRIIVCSDCQTEKRNPPGEVEASECVLAFRNGDTRVTCSRAPQHHRLALRDIAPDLGVKFTPEVDKVDFVSSSLAARGELRGRLGKKVVAVTALDMDKAVRYGHTDPWQLLYRLCHVHHPNLLPVLGVLRSPLRVVTHVEGSVDLETLMRRENDALVGDALSVQLQERIALDVARGLECLSKMLKVAHGLVCPRHVYVVSVDAESGESVAKLSVPADASSKFDEDSWRYQPPEVLQSGSQCTIAGDVYAFGMLLYVLAAAGCFATYKVPFGAKAATQAWRKEEKIEKICEQALRPTMPSLASAAFVKVAYRCWDADPAQRGSFSDIVRDLEQEASDEPNQTVVRDPELASEEAEMSLVSRTMADLKDAVLNTAVIGGRYVWAATSGSYVAVFDLSNNMEQVGNVLPTPVVITCLCAVDDAVWGGSQDGTVCIWKRTGKAGDDWTVASRVRHHNNALTAMRSFADNTELVITGDLSGDLMLWNRRNDFAHKKPTTLSFPGSAVRAIEAATSGQYCYVSLSTSVVKVRLSTDDFAVVESFALPGAPGLQGSISGMLVGADAVWVAGNRSMWLLSPSKLAVQKEVPLPKSTAKVLALLMIRVGASRFAPCTVSVTSAMELWDPATKEPSHSFSDKESERHQGKGGVLLSNAINLGEDALLIGRNNQLIVWHLGTAAGQ